MTGIFVELPLLRRETSRSRPCGYVEDGTGCWVWAGTIDRHTGYGKVAHEWAHRAVYRFLRGDIPEGLTIDHLCRNRPCVNPDHLEPVPQRVNALRGVSFSAVNAAKTHCPQGHEYVDFPWRGQRWRRCPVCIRQRGAAIVRLKPTCKRGHLRTESNTRCNAQGQRICLDCPRWIEKHSHCSRGHELTAENRLRTHGGCKECKKLSTRAERMAKRLGYGSKN